MSKSKGPTPFGEALKRFVNREPVQMSEKTRELARRALAARDASKNEDPKVWAQRLTDNMYGKDKRKK